MPLVFNEKFYSRKSIQTAVAAYSKLASFKTKKRGKYFDVHLTRPKGDLTMIENEFANYVLFLNLKNTFETNGEKIG